MLAQAYALMEAAPEVGAGGARLVGRDGVEQPSARAFPSLWNDCCLMSGLAARFPDSRLFNALNGGGLDTSRSQDTGWITGAFMILPRRLVQDLGGFDDAFFLYSEEVDLCKRIHQAGRAVRYWPELEVVHYGGEKREDAG